MAKPAVPYFLSYAHRDVKLVDPLFEDLKIRLSISKAYDFQPWRDTGILPGEDWDNEIQTAVSECALTILLISPTFLSRPYILTRELPRLLAGDKVVIPVELCPVDLGRYEMQRLDRLQMYGLSVDGRTRAYSECRDRIQRDRFLMGLQAGIEARLRKL